MKCAECNSIKLVYKLWCRKCVRVFFYSTNGETDSSPQCSSHINMDSDSVVV